MNKSDLISKMATDAKVTKAQAQAALNSFITATTGALKKGDKLILVGFGTFSVTHVLEKKLKSQLRKLLNLKQVLTCHQK
jgi:nucleoid DNA-binding protein